MSVEVNAFAEGLRGTVAETLEPASVVDLLFDLVSIRSESGQEQAVGAYLVDRMAELGLDAHLDGAGNAVGEVGSGSRRLVLLGHMDTVPGGPPPEIRDGRLYGRGAVDAKGPLACFVVAAALMARDPDFADLDLQLTVIGAVEEEVSSSKGARFAAAHIPAPDACIIGEPSGAGGMTLGYKGRLLAHVERRRPSSHSAGPEPTASARIAEDWNRVQALAAELTGRNEGEAESIFHRLQTELRDIQGGPEGDEDVCRACFGFRLPPSLGPRELEERLRGILEDATVTCSGHERAWVAERSSSLARAFLGAVRRVTGKRPRLKKKTGTSDMNVVAPLWGCPILAYGPGDSALDHTPWEHVETAELSIAVEVLVTALRSWAHS